MSRAGSYVLGLMDEADRERAERDLEIDAEFRDAVVRIAERLHLIDLGPAPEPDAADQWKLLAQRISEMPHMRPPGAHAGSDAGRHGKPVADRARPACRAVAPRGDHGARAYRGVCGGLSRSTLASMSGIRQTMPTSATATRNQPKPAKP